MNLYIYFNKETKIPAFYSPVELFNTNLLVKVIDIEKDLGITDGTFNMAQYRWEGDYDTGNLVDLFKEKKHVVTEEEIDKKYNGIFFRKYSKIEDIIYAILQSSTFEEGSKAIEMQRFLYALMKKKEKEIEFYKNSDAHIYETNEFREKREHDTFKI